jgi:hypothetical protein
VTIERDAARTVDVALQADILKLGAFVVEGTREGQARALQQKRTADNIIDVVSADSAGKLPDGNAPRPCAVCPASSPKSIRTRAATSSCAESTPI